VDLVLAALGRRPNVDGLGLAELGAPLDERGTPVFNRHTMQVGDLPIYMAGDANADRPLFHEACDEGAIAGFNAARGEQTAFMRKVALGVAFSDPDVLSVGQSFDKLPAEAVLIGSARGEGNGRSRLLGGADGLLRVYAERGTGRLLGASMVAIGGEHLAHLLAWSIQRGETARSLLQAPFYHPVLEELLQSALQDIARQQGDHEPWPMGLRPLNQVR
jgi:dihydrolipoamide dehydrogenase